ncbi:DNA-directed RNA polymerase sigma-70 factor [Echinicola pacifica]|uniref:DNA-directed RNA polymerase sigma-70 factor n=1 Tax=Echinicola pacifica TaxID=346377 RepID=A0A918USP3_9BACT|nr:RNA polymerase sigma-70 factor [Echinicola pacifica]GGZ30524.1 DNA-directed RNA polymerase sigma-70 factor [Echinicola pacifica]
MGLSNLTYTQELLSAVALGNEAAFKCLFSDYHLKVYQYANSLLKDPDLAEDMVQEVFIGLWQERIRLTKIDNFDGYLFTIVKRKSIDYIRKINSNHRLKEKIIHQYCSISHPDFEFEEKGFLNNLKEVLSPQQKIIFELSREQGLSYEEIAEHMNISKNTVRNHMVKALENLRNVLDKPLILLFLLILATLRDW